MKSARKTTLKALFVSHETGIYGGQRSLQLLLRSLTGIDITLVIPKAFPFQKANNLLEISSDYGVAVENIYEFYLPRDYCYEGCTTGILAESTHAIRRLFWLLSNKKLFRFLRTNEFDFIHLNSITLNQIINDENLFFLHIREVIDQLNVDNIRRITSTAGLIFIDNSTRATIEHLDLPPQIVLNNPVDMTKASSYSEDSILEDIGLTKEAGDSFVSLIGNIHPVKGVDFIIEAFRDCTATGLRLLVVGNGDERYIKTCRRLSKGDPRILFLGETREIEKIYRVSDYIIRGDETFRIGRTIFEGLYAQCGVIIPGMTQDLKRQPEFMHFLDRTHVYKPRDRISLVKLLNALPITMKSNEPYLSNCRDYASDFLLFIVDNIPSDRRYGTLASG